MARDKSPLQIKLEYYPVLGLLRLLRWLPLKWSEKICQKLVGGLICFLTKRQKIMDDNLALAFPSLSSDERRRLAKKSLYSLARGIARYSRIPQWARDGMAGWVRPEGFQYTEEAFRMGKGVLAFTAHYGFWEIIPVYLQQSFGRTWAVGRPLDNPLLDKLVNSMRGASGAHVIPQHQILRQGLRLLRDNQFIAILIDQNFYKGGVFVDFFGRLAATTHIISLFARRTGCTVLPLYTAWEGDRLRIIFEAPVRLSDHPDPKIAMAEDTQKMTKIVEGWIRKDPEQWFWLHNRWKRRPEPGDWVYQPVALPAER